MRTLNEDQRIADLLAVFQSEVSVRQASSYTDVNRASQEVLRKLLSVLFELPRLQNLDFTERPNFPALDLGDKEKRVAFQVTSDSSGTKIKSSFTKFFANDLQKDYDKVMFFFLTGRQNAYTVDLSESIPSGFAFDDKQDVLDVDGLLPLIQGSVPSQKRAILTLLEEEFGDGGLRDYAVPEETLDENRSVFVPPAEFDLALAGLNDSLLLILHGPPHVGKSSTALALLRAVQGDDSRRRILKMDAQEASKKVGRIKGESIWIDDAFGATEFDQPQAANAIRELERLAAENRVVLTSRSTIFEEARRRAKIGETNASGRCDIRLAQKGSYGPDALREILLKQLAYHARLHEEGPQAMPAQLREVITKNAAWIVSKLDFPHNIERLVFGWRAVPQGDHYVDRLIRVAREIEVAAGRWFETLDDPQRFRVILAIIFPSPTARERRSILQEVGAERINDRVLADQSGGFLKFDRELAIGHPSYGEGILNVLKERYREDAILILRLASASLEKYDLTSVSHLGFALRRIKMDEPSFGDYLPEDDISVEAYFTRFVNAYNAIIECEFSAMRVAFDPNVEGQSRVHLYLDAEGELTGWCFAPRKEDGLSVTSSAEVSRWDRGEYTSVEHEQLEVDRFAGLTWHRAPPYKRQIPEVEALRSVQKQVEKNFESKGGMILGETLLKANLMAGLASTAFPMDEIGLDRPLTSEWLREWAEPYLRMDATGEWPRDADGRRVSYKLYEYPTRINELNLDWTIAWLNGIAAAGQSITEPFLVTRDLPWDQPWKRQGVRTTSDWYSDERMLKAVRVGLTRRHEVLREVLPLAFPNLMKRAESFYLKPIEIDCVITRDIEESMARPRVAYGYRTNPDQTPGEPFRLRIYMDSPDSPPEKRAEAQDVLEQIWARDGRYNRTGLESFRVLVTLKDWIKDVNKDIQREFKDVLRHDENTLGRWNPRYV